MTHWGAALSSPPQPDSEGCSLHLEGECRIVLRDGRTKQEVRDWALQSQTASWKETGRRSGAAPGTGCSHPGAGTQPCLTLLPRGCNPVLDQFLTCYFLLRQQWILILIKSRRQRRKQTLSMVLHMHTLTSLIPKVLIFAFAKYKPFSATVNV